MGVRIESIDIVDEQRMLTWEHDRKALEDYGVTKEQYDIAVAKGNTFQVYGQHDITRGDRGQGWASVITLYAGCRPDTVYHEFGHAADLQGKTFRASGQHNIVDTAGGQRRSRIKLWKGHSATDVYHEFGHAADAQGKLTARWGRLHPRQLSSRQPNSLRQMDVGQRAMFGDKARKYYEAEAKKRQIRKSTDSVPETFPEQKTGKARDQAGKAVGVSGRTMDKAKKVREQGVPRDVLYSYRRLLNPTSS